MTPSPGEGLTATDRLDKVFEVGIVLKGLDGLLGIAGGVLLLLIKPQYLNQLASTLTQHELSADPHDFLSSYILHATHNRPAARRAHSCHPVNRAAGPYWARLVDALIRAAVPA